MIPLPLKSFLLPIVATALYLGWESQATGDIRIDLLLIYPVLALVYLISLWKLFKMVGDWHDHFADGPEFLFLFHFL